MTDPYVDQLAGQLATQPDALEDRDDDLAITRAALALEHTTPHPDPENR